MRRVFGEATVLKVAHRTQIVMDCDRVMILDKGRIVEFDNPHVLLETNPQGHFAQLVHTNVD
jgi:ABC-type multidrug transport system fused ATPase/permease subunit